LAKKKGAGEGERETGLAFRRRRGERRLLPIMEEKENPAYVTSNGKEEKGGRNNFARYYRIWGEKTPIIGRKHNGPPGGGKLSAPKRETVFKICQKGSDTCAPKTKKKKKKRAFPMHHGRKGGGGCFLKFLKKETKRWHFLVEKERGIVNAIYE